MTKARERVANTRLNALSYIRSFDQSQQSSHFGNRHMPANTEPETSARGGPLGACWFELRNEIHRPLMFGDSHFFGVAPSGACWCIDGILCLKNRILRSEFGGYTAHHLPLVLTDHIGTFRGLPSIRT
jgi:hypothetical protein